MTAAEIAPGDAGGVGGKMTTDEYLARELMGFHVSILPNPWGGTNAAGAYEKDGVIEYWKVEDWHPSTSIEQALGDGGPGTVVGKLWEQGYNYLMERHHEFYPNYRCVIWKNEENSVFTKIKGEATADTPSAAISEAALKALEGEGR